MNSVAVVIPLYRVPLPEEEEISLACVRSVLANHPRFFVVPDELHIPPGLLAGEHVVRFPKAYFTYPHGYNRLLMSRRFFDEWTDYDFILLYQLDCLVLSDQLAEWCSKNYDYVGAPWYDDFGRPNGDKIWRVGNGGFSLRRVATARSILAQRIRRGSLFDASRVLMPQITGLDWFLTNVRHRLKQHLGLWTVEDELRAAFCENEDRFWALTAPKLRPNYRKPEVEEALGFAFELEPRECLLKRRGRLPFGCHAWAKYDREFWAGILRQALSGYAES